MATIDNINVSTPNDGLGDSLRNSQIKANNNFFELNDKKVEKELGKGLSANDFTDVAKGYLESIEYGAEVNVQADFLQEDDTADDYIKNKPPQLFAGIGYFDYNDSGATTLTYVSGVDKKITNDALGEFTNLDNPPYGITSLWNTTTNQFDFSQLTVGDQVDIRIKLIPTTSSANEVMKVKIKFGIGSPSEFTEIFNIQYRKNASTDDYIFYTGFYIGSEDILNYPAEVYFVADGGGTLKVGGFYIRAIRKDVALLPFNNETDFVKKRFYDYQDNNSTGTDVLLDLSTFGNQEIRLINSSLISVAGISLNSILTTINSEVPYQGKQIIIWNLTGSNITLKNEFITDYPFILKDGLDLILPNNEKMLFAFSNDGLYDIRTFTDLSGKQDVLNAVNLGEIIDNELSIKITPDDNDEIPALDSITGEAVTFYRSSFQDKLVSGTNIKTINGNSILGSGNLTIATASLLREEFTFSGSQTFTLSSNYAQVYSVEVQGQGALSTSQYSLVSPNQVTISNTLSSGDYVVIIYSNSATGVQPYYSQSEVDNLLLSKQNKFYINKITTPSTSVTGTLSETELVKITIPANTFSSSDIIRIPTIFISKTGVNNAATVRLKISTSSTMPSGATGQIAQFTVNTTTLYQQVSRIFYVASGQLKGHPFTTASNTDITSATTALSSVAFDVTQTQYLYLSGTLLSSADSMRIEGLEILN